MKKDTIAVLCITGLVVVSYFVFGNKKDIIEPQGPFYGPKHQGPLYGPPTETEMNEDD